MVSKHGTFKAEDYNHTNDAIFFSKTKTPVCVIVRRDMLQWVYSGYIMPSDLRELADFLETLNAKTE